MARRVLPFLLLAGGCYGYYPAAQPSPVGRDVLITLTDSGSVVLAGQLGPAAESLIGRVTTDSANSVVIAATSVHQRNGNDTEWRGEHVVIPRPLVSTVVERRFSRARTALLTGIVAIAAVALRDAFNGSGYSTGANGLPGTGGAK